LFECTALTKMFGPNVALNNLSLSFGPGRIVGLLGPNGSGKTTLIKIAAGLLVPTSGTLTVAGIAPGLESRSLLSYLPERTYLNSWMKVDQIIDYFADFYSDFDKVKAYEMLGRLGVPSAAKLKTLSKGTKEKVQLILVMSRKASLYLLDEPIGGVDPATRDYILDTIISNYHEKATVIISTHLIGDVEKALDEFVFIRQGQLLLHATVDAARQAHGGKSVDEIFREVFRC